jgi:hypothetical protein
VQGQNALPATGSAVTKIPSTVEHDANCRIIYLGFVGALERSDNKDSGVVQIRNELRGKERLAKVVAPYFGQMDGIGCWCTSRLTRRLSQTNCSILPEDPRQAQHGWLGHDERGA